MQRSSLTGAADAICRSYRRATGAVQQVQIGGYESVVAAARGAVAKLRALPAPAGTATATAFARFVDDTDAAIDLFVAAQARSSATSEASQVSLEQRDLSTYQRAGRDASAADAAAHRLGLAVCGSPGSDWL